MKGIFLSFWVFFLAWFFQAFTGFGAEGFGTLILGSVLGIFLDGKVLMLLDRDALKLIIGLFILSRSLRSLNSEGIP